jgi:hypothetical protein
MASCCRVRLDAPNFFDPDPLGRSGALSSALPLRRGNERAASARRRPSPVGRVHGHRLAAHGWPSGSAEGGRRATNTSLDGLSLQVERLAVRPLRRSGRPADQAQRPRHRSDTAALLAAAGERDTLDDVEAGVAQRLLVQVADVDLDGDEVLRLERQCARDELGHATREVLLPDLRVRLEVDEKDAAVAEATELRRLLGARWRSANIVWTTYRNRLSSRARPRSRSSARAPRAVPPRPGARGPRSAGTSRRPAAVGGARPRHRSLGKRESRSRPRPSLESSAPTAEVTTGLCRSVRRLPGDRRPAFATPWGADA